MALTPPVLPKNGFTSPAYGLKNTTVSNVQPTNSDQPDYKSLYQNYYNTVNNNDYSNVMQQAQDSAARAANQKRMGYQSSLNLLGSNLNTGLSGVNSSLDSNKQDLQDRTFQNYLASRQNVANSGMSGTGLANDADTRVQMANNRSLANIERDANQQKYALQNSYNTQSQGIQDQMNAIDQAGMAQDLFNQMKGQEMQARAQQANGMLNYIQALQSQDQRNLDNQWKQKTFDTQNEQWSKTFDRQGEQQNIDNNFKQSAVTGYFQQPEVQKMLDQIQQNKQINATTQDEAARQQAQLQNQQLYQNLLKYGIDGQTLFNSGDANQTAANFAKYYQGSPTLQKQQEDEANKQRVAQLMGTLDGQPTLAKQQLDSETAYKNSMLALSQQKAATAASRVGSGRSSGGSSRSSGGSTKKPTAASTYGTFTGYFTNKFGDPSSDRPTISEVESDIRNNADSFASEGYDINKVVDAAYNAYSNGQFTTKKAYDAYVKKLTSEREKYYKDNPVD